MLNLFIYYFLLIILLFMSFLSLFLNDLFFIWLLMEINNFLFISFLSMNMKNKKMIFFYYIIQIIPSMILILSISINNISLINNNIILILMYLMIMIKLSIPPFHFWIILMSYYMKWNNLLIMLSIQKIIPFYMLLIIKMNKFFLNFSLIMCSFIPPMMMFNLTNFKKLMSYSSINQLSWMLLFMYMKPLLWLIHMIMYTLIMFFLMKIFMFYKFYFNYFNMKNYLLYNLFILILIMNLMGIPPFSLFMFKWLSIFLLINNFNLFFMSFIMIFSSFIMLFLYLNMIYLIMFMNLVNSKLFYMKFNYHMYNNYFKMFTVFLTLFFPLFLLIF